MIKRKALIDDGCNPELVRGAEFDGIMEIPIIKAPKEIIIPSGIIPFSQIHKATDFNNAIGFYEMDVNFGILLQQPEIFVNSFLKFKALITPDCSLYRDAPLAVQIINTYRNRAIGRYYQSNGAYVIPQIRWGSEETYTTKVLPEKIAFLGVEKNSIVAIGTYGCIRGKENKYYFSAGLEAMLESLTPKVVLVYGPMPETVFGIFQKYTNFYQYDDWTTARHK